MSINPYRLLPYSDKILNLRRVATSLQLPAPSKMLVKFENLQENETVLP